MSNKTYYGQRAFDLIKTLKRNTNSLQPFDEESLRYIFEESKWLFNQNHQDFTSSLGVSAIFPTIHVRHAILERNRRCLLAYLYTRLLTIQQMRWDFGSVLPNDILNNLYEPELKWFNNYCKILAKYMRSIDSFQGFDITNNLSPPKGLTLEVRCLTDFGKVELDSGEAVTLKKNYIYMLPRTLAEPLIRRGILSLVTL